MVILAALAAGASPQRSWTFDQDSPGKPPAGFSFGLTARLGKPGRWVVTPGKAVGKVLAQIDKDATNARYPIAVADEPSLANLRVKVRCQPISGEVDQACGLVFRYRDENNYYVTRANALEDNVRLYHVKDGKRKQFATWDGKVAPGVWHTLEAEARGDLLRVFWNGKKVIEARDTTFVQPGKVGVWTKADSVTYFDDLEVVGL